MSDFVTVKMSGLKEMDKALNELDLNVRKNAVRPSLRKAMTPVLKRVESNASAIEDTGGLAGTVKMTTSFAQGKLKKAGKKAAAIGSVSMGSSRRREGKTGHQALQVEYGTQKRAATPVLRPAVSGHERDIIQDFAKELGQQIPRVARLVARKRK